MKALGRFASGPWGGGGEGVGRMTTMTAPFLVRQRKLQKLPLVDEKGRLNVETRGLPKTFLYWGDLFHTLVNMPNMRFIGILCITYLLLFGGFAVPYYYDAYNNNCIPGVMEYKHALWFSVQTSMTIGYGGDLTPDPSCTLTNIMVVVQSLASLLVMYSLLGVFYVRFSRPARRAQTVIFSRYVTMHDEDGVPVISLRIANIRKHQIIEANVRLLIGFNNMLGGRDDETVFHFTSLPVIGGNQVFLGLPCSVKHPITSTSPLFGLSIEELEDADMEILVLLEGVDASTSCKLQARHSYLPKDMRKDFRHETMVFRSANGRRCVDFAKFDSLLPVSTSLLTRPDSSATLPPISQAGRYNFLPKSDVGNEECEVRMWDFLTPTHIRNNNNLHHHHHHYDIKPRSLLRTASESSVLLEEQEEEDICPKSSQSMPEIGRDYAFSLMTSECSDQAYEHKLAAAEARSQALKKQLVELASRVHQTLQQPLSAADANRGPLIACASQALELALSPN